MMSLLKQRKPLLIGGGVVVAILIVAVAVFALTRPAPEPAPEPEEEPIVVEDIPEEIKPETWTFPLTGIETADKEATLSRILSVKIENTPMARPQTGVSGADVVYETVTEGGITRFNCLFQSEIPSEVGPVRSGRLSDTFIVPQYDALFFYSGANAYVNRQLANTGLDNMSHGVASSLYYRVNYREAPHNLYLNLPKAYTLASEMGFATTVETPQALEFAEAGADGATGADGGDSGAGAEAGVEAEGAGAEQGATRKSYPDAAGITVPFSDGYIAQWTWDSATKTYLRSMDGATLDAATDAQIAANNVVVLWANYVTASEDKKKTFFVDLNGPGTAALFIDGKRIDGTWESDGVTPPRFKDSTGTPILLTPGKTWFQVLNTTEDVTITD
jgi:hypothetical protein